MLWGCDIDSQYDIIQFESIKRKVTLSEAKTESEINLKRGGRNEMDHLQNNYLDKIELMVDANERCMELLVNQNNYI